MPACSSAASASSTSWSPRSASARPPTSSRSSAAPAAASPRSSCRPVPGAAPGARASASRRSGTSSACARAPSRCTQLIEAFDPPDQDLGAIADPGRAQRRRRPLRKGKVTAGPAGPRPARRRTRAPPACCSMSTSGRNSTPRPSRARSRPKRTRPAPPTRACSSISSSTPPPMRPALWSSASAPTSTPTSRTTTRCAPPFRTARSASGR